MIAFIPMARPRGRYFGSKSKRRRSTSNRSVSGGLDTEAAGNHRRQSGWRSYCTAGFHLLNPSLVLNHLVRYEGSIVGSVVKEGVERVNSENAAINETRRSQMSGTKLKLLYIRVSQIVAPALLVIGLAACAHQSADKPIISLSTVSKLDRSQAGIYRTKIGKIDVIAVSDGTVGLGLTKELIQNAKPGEVERLLARHFQKSPLDASVNAFLIKYEDKL